MLTQSAIDPTALHVCRGESSFFFIWSFHLVLAKGARAPQEIFCRREIDRLLQIFSEKGREFIEWDEFHPVIKVNVTGAWNDDQFFGLTGQLVSLFAELPGIGNLTRNEERGARRNRLNVRERVKIHELHVTAERRMRREVRRTALGREFTSRSAVEVVKTHAEWGGSRVRSRNGKNRTFPQDFELNHAPEDVHCETHRGAGGPSSRCGLGLPPV